MVVYSEPYIPCCQDIISRNSSFRYRESGVVEKTSKKKTPVPYGHRGIDGKKPETSPTMRLISPENERLT